MRVLNRSAAAVLLATPGLVLAAPTLGYLDAYAVLDSEIDAEVGDASGDVEGDGYGLKGALSFGERFFLAGEYQETEYDDLCCEIDDSGALVVDSDGNAVRVDAELTQYRAGLGLRSDSFGSTIAFALAQYVRFESDVSDNSGDLDGYGVHAGLRGENGRLGVTVQIGYLDLDEADGPEYQIEADYRLFDAIGLFANYRITDLDNDDFDIEERTADFRVGATIYLGG